MKTIVYDDDFEELEIRPSEAIAEYRRLLADDVRARLVAPGGLAARVCPGCRAAEPVPAFERFGLDYQECGSCGSLYVSPCPADTALVAFYREAPASRFWREQLWAETRDARRRRVYRPLAEWILDTVDRHAPGAATLVDVSYHSRVVVRELAAAAAPFERVVLANPIADIEGAGLDLPGLSIDPRPFADVAGLPVADVVLALDALPRVSDAESLLESARHALRPGGLLFVTATSASGFDLQVLWDRAPSLYPPDRLNVLSAEALTLLVERHGFEIIEFSTPGMFDVDIVRRALEEDPSLACGRFVRHLVGQGDLDSRHRFQEFLQASRHSSFVRLVVRRV